MSVRKLTEPELALVKELNLRIAQLAGERLDEDPLVVRRDPYYVVLRRGLSSHESILANIDALKLKKNSRLGNHMISLANCLVLCHVLGIKKVFIPKNDYFLDQFTVEGVHFDSAEPSDPNTLEGNFFYRYTFAQHYRSTKSPIELFHLFRPALRALSGGNRAQRIQTSIGLFAKSTGKTIQDVMTIHIRSGDIFEASSPHPRYWQPPLCFYKRVIKLAKPKRVDVVFENQANPVIPALISWLQLNRIRHRLIQESLDQAILEISTARHLVAGRGTFLYPLVAMNRRLSRLSIFAERDSVKRLHRLPQVRAGALEVDFHSAYGFENLVSPWMNTMEQRQLMLEWDCTSGNS